MYTNAQNDGVVILGASNNTVGANKRLNGSAGNTISGNLQVGVYVTSRDFNGMLFSVPTGNTVSGNVIQHRRLYGVLLYDAPNNAVRPFTSPSRFLSKNTFGGETTSFRNFQAGFDAGTSLPTSPAGRSGGAAHRKAVAHRGRAAVHHGKAAVHHGKPAIEHAQAAAVHHPAMTAPALARRPRVPALFEV